MGWFSSSLSPDSASTSGSAPDRSQRSQCWESRDAYFACLDKNGVQVPGQEGEGCKTENDMYKGKCAGSWSRMLGMCPSRADLADLVVSFPSSSSFMRQVDYFNKRRVLQLRQDLMERRAAEQVAASK
ncbi:cytochromec oxidase, subunit VIb [Rhodotorula toruloides]|uniref:Cytochromec oxidase, subunit VIb n=1 Tax=Rhodotorula toruloides TaxID=5286 RepID=A0A511KC84_RHOTO|nr:cytochromec oxidase, subunit VIb [Rhodotorula toruloides]